MEGVDQNSDVATYTVDGTTYLPESVTYQFNSVSQMLEGTANPMEDTGCIPESIAHHLDGTHTRPEYITQYAGGRG